MKHIIEDRYASIYQTYLPDYRVGPSCPVVFNKRLQASRGWNQQGGYMAFCRFTDVDGRGYVRMMQRPTASDDVITLEAGQRCDYVAPVLG